MLRNSQYWNDINNWISIFKSKLNSTKFECIPFYILNKKFLNFPQIRGNLNEKLLKECNGKLIIEPENKFLILDENTWLKIKHDYPTEKELKVNGSFNNKKCVFSIDPNLFYFYFLNNNNIEEGYMKFDKHENADLIIVKLFKLETDDFFKEMKIKKDTNEIQNIYYHNNSKHFYFLFKLKNDDRNKINNNINQFRQNNANNEWLRKNQNNDNNIKIHHHEFNGENLNYNKNNNKNNNENKIKINNFLNNANISLSTSLKIYKCFYYYIQFKKNLETIHNSNWNENMEIFLVNKSWFNSFKEQCGYYKIKNELIANDKFKENIVNDLAKRFPLNPKILENKPKPVKREIIGNNEFYYYDYDFFDEITVNEFSKTFNIFKKDNIFIKVKVYILKNKIIIVIYNENNLELMKKDLNEKYLFSIKSKGDIRFIIDLFQKSKYEDCFKYLNIKDKNIIEQKIYNLENINIGKVRNLSSMNINNQNMDNNNKMKRYKSANRYADINHNQNLLINNNKNTNKQQNINYDKLLPNNKFNIKNNQNELSIKEKTENILYGKRNELKQKKVKELSNKNFDDLKSKQNEQKFDKKNGNEIKNMNAKKNDDDIKKIIDKKDEDKNEKKFEKENGDDYESKFINEMKQKILMNEVDKKTENDNKISDELLKKKEEKNMNLKIINDKKIHKEGGINENLTGLNKSSNKNKIDNNNKDGINNIKHKKNHTVDKNLNKNLNDIYLMNKKKDFLKDINYQEKNDTSYEKENKNKKKELNNNNFSNKEELVHINENKKIEFDNKNQGFINNDKINLNKERKDNNSNPELNNDYHYNNKRQNDDFGNIINNKFNDNLDENNIYYGFNKYDNVPKNKINEKAERIKDYKDDIKFDINKDNKVEKSDKEENINIQNNNNNVNINKNTNNINIINGFNDRDNKNNKKSDINDNEVLNYKSNISNNNDDGTISNNILKENNSNKNEIKNLNEVLDDKNRNRNNNDIISENINKKSGVENENKLKDELNEIKNNKLKDENKINSNIYNYGESDDNNKTLDNVYKVIYDDKNKFKFEDNINKNQNNFNNAFSENNPNKANNNNHQNINDDKYNLNRNGNNKMFNNNFGFNNHNANNININFNENKNIINKNINSNINNINSNNNNINNNNIFINNNNNNNIINNNNNFIINNNNNNNFIINNNNNNNIIIHNNNNNNFNMNVNNNFNNNFNNINLKNNIFNNNNNINQKNFQNHGFINDEPNKLMANNNNNKNNPIVIKPDIDVFSLIKRPSAKGLVNVGATCYMNATLQCMAHIRKLTKFLLNFQNTNEMDGNKYKLTKSYKEVLDNLWLNDKINNYLNYYSPDNFKNIISKMNPLFAGIQANDSKDLVLFMLETMHNELNEPNKNIQENAAGIPNQYDFNITFNMFKHYFAKNYNSIMSNLFYGMYNSMMTCLNCKVTTHNVQCYNILIFPLEEVRIFKNRTQNMVNIIECFEYYQKTEHMRGENQIYCNNCKTMADCNNITKIIICPNILVINLNRGKGLEFNVKIEFDEYLDLINFVHFKETPSFYELIGMVTHFGPSSMSGHFIAFCKSFIDGQWYKYNDSQVNLSSFNEAKSTGVPYILFYSYIKR